MPSFVCPFIIGTYININKKENEKRSILFYPYHRIPHFRNDFRTGEATPDGSIGQRTSSSKNGQRCLYQLALVRQ